MSINVIDLWHRWEVNQEVTTSIMTDCGREIGKLPSRIVSIIFYYMRVVVKELKAIYYHFNTGNIHTHVTIKHACAAVEKVSMKQYTRICPFNSTMGVN